MEWENKPQSINPEGFCVIRYCSDKESCNDYSCVAQYSNCSSEN